MRVLLVVYDNDSYIGMFPSGLGYIAAVLEKEGIDVEIYSQDVHHYPDSHLTEYLDNNKFDVIGVSLIAGYYQYHKLLGLSEAINKSKNRPYYIIGGYGPTPEPEFFMNKTNADMIVQGEGEITIVEVMSALTNKTPMNDILGIVYRENGKINFNPRRGLIEDIDSIPIPAYHKFPMEHYRLKRFPNVKRTDFTMPMMSGRGCTFKCTFCYRMDPGYRSRSPDAIMEEIAYLKKEFGITYILFFDDLLMTSASHTEDICKAFIKANLGVSWICNGRLNYCTPELLKLMKDAGCVFINYGIESVDNTVLKNMKKGLNYEKIISGIEQTLDIGISPGLNMLFGNIGDSRDTLERAVEFLLKYDDFAQVRTIRPVTPYPGSPMYYDAIEKGLLKDVEDFYENKHLNSEFISVNFTELSDNEFYDCLEWANKTLLKNYHDHARKDAMDKIEYLYQTRDANFRGNRDV